MPKLTDISRRTESGPENNKFLNKTVPKKKNFFRKYLWKASMNEMFDVLNANLAKIRI